MPRASRSTLLGPLVALALAVLSCSLAGCGGSTTAPRAVTPSTRVLVLGDAGGEDSLIAILRADGLEVTEGPEASEYDGHDLGRYAAVVLPVGRRYGDTLQTLMATRLMRFVAEGGGLVTTDWLSYYRATTFANVAPLLVSGSRGSYSVQTSEHYSVMLAHPVVAGLPASFALPADCAFGHTRRDSTHHPDSQMLVHGSVSGAAVVVAPIGAGRVVHWNLAPGYGGPAQWSAPMRRLLCNAVRHVGGL